MKIYLFYFLISMVPLLAFSVDDDLDKLADDYLCYGGGMDFKHEVASEYYTYREFINTNSTCTSPPTANSNDGLGFQDIHQKILNYNSLKDSTNKCPEIDTFLKEYIDRSTKIYSHIDNINNLRKINIFDKVNVLDSVYEKIKNIENEINADSLTIRAASLANTAVFCGASDISLKTTPMWRLKVLLLGGNFAGEVEEMVESGQTSKGCKNVKASGSKNLENFYVNVEGADKTKPLIITYDTKSVPDQVKASRGAKLLHDSTCLGTKGNISHNIELKPDDTVIKIDVGANCSTGGVGGTFWEVLVQCTEEESPPDPMTEQCLEQMNELISLIDDGINYSKKIHSHYWKQSVCYVKHHTDLKSDYSGAMTRFKEIEINRCSNKKCSPYPIETGPLKYVNVDFNPETKTELFKMKNKNTNGSNSKDDLKSGKIKISSKERKLIRNQMLFKNQKKLLSSLKKTEDQTNPLTNLMNAKENFNSFSIDSKLEEEFKKMNIDSKKLVSKGLNIDWFKRKNSEDEKQKLTDIEQARELLKQKKELRKAFQEKDGKTYIDLKFFNLYRRRICEAQNRNSELFSQISLRYCLSGFPVLLKRSN